MPRLNRSEICAEDECNAETLLDFVKNFRKLFRNESGLLQNRQHFRFARRQARSASGVS